MATTPDTGPVPIVNGDGGGYAYGAPLSYRITSYYKRPRSNPGITQLASQRLDVGAAVQWIINDLPENAVGITDHGAGRYTIELDLSDVPTDRGPRR